MDSLQKSVEKYCQECKVKKKDLANQIGVTPVQLSHWLAGRTRFSLTKLEKVKAIIADSN